MTDSEYPWRDESLLYELYWEQELITVKIADELGCIQQTVSKWMQKFDIPRRDAREAAPNRRRHPAVFTDRDYVICASNYRGTTDSVGIHRLIMVAELGFEAVAGKHVHHKNGVKRDNRAENLELPTRAEHAERHGFGSEIKSIDHEWDVSNRERDERGRFK